MLSNKFETKISCNLQRTLIIAFVLSLPTIAFACHANGICGGMGYCQQAIPVQPTMCNCGPSYGCGPYGCYRVRARASKNYKPPLGNHREQLTHRFSPLDQKSTEDDILIHSDEFRDNENLPFRSKKKLPSRKTEPMEILEERKILALASPTAAELPTKARAYQDPNEAFLDCCMDRQLPDSCLDKCNFNSFNKQRLTAMYFRQDPCPMAAMKELQFCAAQGRDHRSCCMRNGVTTTIAGAKCLTFCDQRPGVITQLDFTYLPCFDRFENMKACFWQDIIRYFT